VFIGRRIPGDAAAFGGHPGGGVPGVPPQAYALEVGCFCTFVFISSMLMLSLGVTLVSKSLITKRFWRLSWKRVSLITVLELIVLFAILLLIQKVFYVRLLIYLAVAFLLNFAMISSTDAIQQGLQTRRRRSPLPRSQRLSCRS